MSHVDPFRVDLPPDVPPLARAELRAVLQSYGTVQETTPRSLDWAAFVALMEQLGKVAGGSVAVIKLAESLYGYAQKLRQHGQHAGTLARPNQPPLDLNRATPEEIQQWLLNTPPQP